MAEGAISGKTWCPRGFVTIEEALAQIDLGLDGRLGEDVRAAIRRLSAHREQMPDDLGDLEDAIVRELTRDGHGQLDSHGEMPINEHLASPWDEGEVLTVVVEYDEPDGFGGGYEVGRAPEGSPELAELVEKAVRDVDDYVASGMEWASAFKGIGDFEDVNAGTAELLHTASKDDRCYDLDSESRDMEAASYTLDDHLAAIERQEREQEQGYDLASACRESCLAADALAEDEKNDPDGRDDR